MNTISPIFCLASILKTPIAVTEPRDIAKNLTLFSEGGGSGGHRFVPNILDHIFQLAFNFILINGKGESS